MTTRLELGKFHTTCCPSLDSSEGHLHEAKEGPALEFDKT